MRSRETQCRWSEHMNKQPGKRGDRCGAIWRRKVQLPEFEPRCRVLQAILVCSGQEERTGPFSIRKCRFTLTVLACAHGGWASSLRFIYLRVRDARCPLR